jgi:RHS repeat-associated protein
MKFTGKADDIEVGLTYFGARNYVPRLGQWASADPLTIQGLQGDPNPYAYVSGRVIASTDPNGLQGVRGELDMVFDDPPESVEEVCICHPHKDRPAEKVKIRQPIKFVRDRVQSAGPVPERTYTITGSFSDSAGGVPVVESSGYDLPRMEGDAFGAYIALNDPATARRRRDVGTETLVTQVILPLALTPLTSPAAMLSKATGVLGYGGRMVAPLAAEEVAAGRAGGVLLGAEPEVGSGEAYSVLFEAR